MDVIILENAINEIPQFCIRKPFIERFNKISQ